MAGDDLLLCGINAEEVAHALSHIAMAGAVESIATYAIFLIQFVRYGIHIGIVWHSLVEGCVEHTNLWKTWHQFRYGIHALEVCGVVKWSEVAALLKHLEHLVGEQHTLVELLSAMHHTVTHGVYLVQVFDNTDFWVGKQ